MWRGGRSDHVSATRGSVPSSLLTIQCWVINDEEDLGITDVKLWNEPLAILYGYMCEFLEFLFEEFYFGRIWTSSSWLLLLCLFPPPHPDWLPSTAGSGSSPGGHRLLPLPPGSSSSLTEITQTVFGAFDGFYLLLVYNRFYIFTS